MKLTERTGPDLLSEPVLATCDKAQVNANEDEPIDRVKRQHNGESESERERGLDSECMTDAELEARHGSCRPRDGSSVDSGGFSQRACPETNHPNKIEKQATECRKTVTVGRASTDLGGAGESL